MGDEIQSFAFFDLPKVDTADSSKSSFMEDSQRKYFIPRLLFLGGRGTESKQESS